MVGVVEKSFLMYFKYTNCHILIIFLVLNVEIFSDFFFTSSKKFKKKHTGPKYDKKYTFFVFSEFHKNTYPRVFRHGEFKKVGPRSLRSREHVELKKSRVSFYFPFTILSVYIVLMRSNKSMSCTPKM